MKSLQRQLLLAVMLVVPGALFAATGEVTLSGSTWTAKVDGVTKYTGTAVHNAIYYCAANMSSGTINLRASGTATAAARIYGNQSVNGNGYTLTSSYAGGVIHAKNVSSTGATNLKIAGSPYYGMYFQTCATQTFSGISGTGGILMRIDNCSGGGGSSFNGGSPNCTASGSHGVETYGIAGVTLGTVTATSRGECGLLLNNSTSSTIGTVNGNHCGTGTGYAAFRTANTNYGPTKVTTVSATNACGRVFYSTTDSQNTTITTCNGSANEHGIWLGSVSKLVKVNGGTISGNGTGTACWTDSNPASYGNVCSVTCTN